MNCTWSTDNFFSSCWLIGVFFFIMHSGEQCAQWGNHTGFVSPFKFNIFPIASKSQHYITRSRSFFQHDLFLVGQQVGHNLLGVVQCWLDGVIVAPWLQSRQPRCRPWRERHCRRGWHRRGCCWSRRVGGGRDWIDSYDWQGVLSSCADHEHLESFGGRHRAAGPAASTATASSRCRGCNDGEHAISNRWNKWWKTWWSWGK